MEQKDGHGQKVMMRDEMVSMNEAMATFNEIMTSKNPLTKEEIRRLHERQPQWSWLAKWY